MKPNIPEKYKTLDQVPTTYKRIACQADHPRVYYNLNSDGYVVCLSVSYTHLTLPTICSV